MTYDNATRIITINEAFEVDHPEKEKVEFIISSGLQNAASAKPTDPFVVSTQSPSGKIID